MNTLLKALILLLFLIITQRNLYAQLNRLTAKVTDLGGSLLTGNLLLTDTAGKVIHRASFNGNIEIKGLGHQSLRLKLSSLFFADTTLLIRYKGNSALNLGTIIPRENNTTLGQVNITAAVPLMRYGNNGSLEVNVAGTILAASSSVTEILSKTPGLTIDEGIISVQGKGEAIIYLNGTRVATERLASIPASQITRIEVISNPSARYDAAGRAVINITTRAPDMKGISGRMSQHLTVSDFAGTNMNSFADLGYTKKGLSVFTNIALLKGRGRELLYTTRSRPDPAEYLNSELYTDWKRNFKSYITYGMGTKYVFSPNKSLSFSYSGNRDQLGGTVNSNNRLQTAISTNNYSSSITRDELRNNHILLMDYSVTTDTLGSNFFISAQYSRYHTGSDDRIDEFGGSSARYLNNLFSQNLHISSIQADRSRALGVKSKLEAGMRYSAVGNSSLNQFFTSQQLDGPYQQDPELSSNFRYREYIGAGYGSFSTKAGKLGITMGARAEWTAYNLTTTAGNGQELKKDYLNLFPNLQLELPLKGEHKLRASYSSRINRPRYQALNPFVIYQDPFTTIEGNPNLVPERAQAIELAANLKKTELKLGYTYAKDLLAAAALRGNTAESYVLKSININSDHALLLSVTRPFSVGNWWQSINIASLSYGKSFDDQYGFAAGKTRPQVYFYTSNTFSLKHGIKLQLLAWYLGSRYTSLRHDEKRSIVTAGIEKSMLSNTVKIGLTANDIFDHTAAVGDYNVGKTQVYYNRRYGNNYFKLTASYRFGSSERPVYQDKRPLQPENNRAN